MSRSVRYGFALALMLFCLSLEAQVDPAFVSHLGKNQLQLEHKTYLRNQQQNDTSSYYFAKYYLQYPDDSLFFDHFKKSGQLFPQDTSALNVASIAFLASEKRSFWFDSCLLSAPVMSRTAREALNIHRSAVAPRDPNFDVESLPVGLQDDFLRYRKSAGKKPLASLALSAAVPGLGKLYIGNKRSAAITFLSLSVLGLQSYESYRKMGIAHPLTVINLGFFATYYAVNLLGSYRETKMKSKEFRNQYLIHASTYYRYKYPDQLYR